VVVGGQGVDREEECMSRHLTVAELDASPPGTRVIDEDGDILERMPDGRWIVISVPEGADPTRGDIWPSRLLRARPFWNRR
jgi:hypothetical protein